MTSELDKQRFSDLLQKIAETIDLTENQYEKATERYKAVGSFLAEKGTLLAPFEPHVMVQGSIRTGTPIRPLTEDEGFDVDLTCVLKKCPYPVKQKEIKGLFEKRLRENANYNRMLDKEKRRCWRLLYSDAPTFHLDIVPAIPEGYDWLLMQGIKEKYAKHAITITDNKHKGYEKYLYENDLPKSNTEGYALWFLDVMEEQAASIRGILEREISKMGKVEKVPEYKVRTPLQRGVQLMKRHRDIRFSDSNMSEFKPVSIVISTLAAKAYEKVMQSTGSTLFYDIVLKMVDEMPNFIEERNGKYYILNPVDTGENFADKWNEPETRYYATTFFSWHSQFRKDITAAFLHEKDLQNAGESLKQKFGDRAVSSAMQLMGFIAAVPNTPRSNEEKAAALFATSQSGHKPWSK